MRMTIEVSGLKEAQQRLSGFSDRRLASVAAAGLNRTIREIAEAERRTMAEVFDRPKPYTLGGVGIKLADIGSLQAEVFLKVTGGSGRGAGKYLQAQVEGGRRERKAYEVLLQPVGIMPQGWRAVPAPAARIDPFGNMDRRQLSDIINQLKRADVGPQQRNATRRAIGAARRSGGTVFVIHEGTKAAPGIYIREFGGRNITAVLLFVRTNQYRKRLPFYEVARQVAEKRAAFHFMAAFNESAARLGGGVR
jgi:hypothetical protein